MTLYLDTSSLVKLYVEEADSEAVREEVARAHLVSTSAVAYPEARAAFARRRRERALTPSDVARAKRALDDDWPRYLVLAPSESICKTAGHLAEQYALRGFDAVHLATFLEVVGRAAGETVVFSSHDSALTKAAARAAQAQAR